MLEARRRDELPSIPTTDPLMMDVGPRTCVNNSLISGLEKSMRAFIVRFLFLSEPMDLVS